MRARTLITLVATVCVVILLLAGCGSASSSSSSASGTASSATTSAATTTATASSTAAGPQIGFEAVPLEQGPDLASPGTTKPVAVDGIQCKPSEQLVYHIHAHLAVFNNGRQYAVPGGIGIPGSQDRAIPVRPCRRRRTVLLLAAHPYLRRRDPHRVAAAGDLHAG